MEVFFNVNAPTAVQKLYVEVAPFGTFPQSMSVAKINFALAQI
jgi:hypothetical protein